MHDDDQQSEMLRLRQENERFKQVLEASITGLVALSTDLKFQFVNKTFLDIVQFTHDELLGQSFEKICGEVHTKREMEEILFQVAKGSPSVTKEMTFLRKDKAIVYVWTNFQPLHDKEGKVVGTIGAVRDITEERETQGRLWEIMNSINDYLWSAEIDAEGNFKYRYYSPVVEKVTGRPPEYYYKGYSQVLDTVYPFDRERVERAFHKLIQGEIEQYEHSYRIVLPDGVTVKWVRDNFTVKRLPNGWRIVSGVVSDMSVSKKLEHDLQIQRMMLLHEKARMETVISHIGEGLAVIDEDGNIVSINVAAEELLGWKTNEVLGKPWFTVVRAQTESGVRVSESSTPVRQALTRGRTISTTLASVATYYYERKDKTTIPVSITASPIVTGNNVVGCVIIFKDISLEKEVDIMKTEFISIASHQLRTPLTAVRLYAEMLAEGDAGALNDEQKEYARYIEESGVRMAELVNNLLNLSRLEMGRMRIDPKATNIKKFLSEIVAQFKPIGEKKQCGFSLELTDEEFPDILVDQVVLRETLSNFLSNSIRYSPEHKCAIRVTLDVVRNERADKIKIGVHDTGIGIPEEAKRKVFEKFFRAHNAISMEAEGNGLGLYIIKTIIELAGGSVWFESKAGEGSSFYVTIPIKGMNAREGEKSLSMSHHSPIS